VSVDRTKVLEAAQKHLAKGAFDKAIAEFQKLVKADPKDVRTWLKIGDLQDQLGDCAHGGWLGHGDHPNGNLGA
jgi:Flp pilus assembly protein TadD